MPTPAPGTNIKFTQVASEFTLAINPPSRGLGANFRFAPGTYTPATPAIPTGATAAIKLSGDLGGRTKAVPPPPTFFTPFTSPGTFTSPFTGNVTLLVIGGGGSGGNLNTPAGPAGRAGGGGAGAYIYYNASYPVVAGRVYPISIGAGGVGANGGNTVFTNPGSAPLTLTARGGGKGGDTGTTKNGNPGGCGGGAGPFPAAVGTGNSSAAPTTVAGGKGFPGGITPTPAARSGGGGGCGGNGLNPPTVNPGPTQGTGGLGVTITFTPGPSVNFGGGGSAGGYGPTQGSGGGFPGSVNGTLDGAGGAGQSPTNARGNGFRGAVYISRP